MIRAVAYARFSSDLQREESIEAQTRAIEKYCKEHNYTLINTYADRGISGTTDKRPGLQQMINDANQGKFDVVIVHKLDRLFRDRRLSAIYKGILNDNNVKLLSVLENLQDGPEGIVLESLLDAMSEYYSLNLAREVRKGLNENALNAKATGCPPLGYSIDPVTKKYIINEIEAEAVRMIFEMFLEGHSYKEIITALNQKGYKTKRGVDFGKNSLYEILRNERYTGVYIYVPDTKKSKFGKNNRRGAYDPDVAIRIPDGMPAIISEDDFNKVRIKMTERQHKTAKYSAKQEYLLSGKIICGVCDSAYAGNSRKPRPDHPLYVSYRCTRRNGKEKCNNPEINRDKLEQLVLDKLSTVLFDPKVIPELVKMYNSHIAENADSVASRIKVLKKEIANLDHKINNAVEAIIATGSLALKDRLKELEDIKAKCTFELSELEDKLSQETVSESQVRKLFKEAEEQLRSGTLANRRSIIERYINKVLVFPDRIEIYMNLTDDYTIKETIENTPPKN